MFTRNSISLKSRSLENKQIPYRYESKSGESSSMLKALFKRHER